MGGVHKGKGGKGRPGMDTRNVALSILMDVAERGALCHLSLERRAAGAASPFSPQDRAFLTSLVECTLERAVQLDYLLSQAANRPASALQPLLRNVLRLGACQLLFLDGVADHAALYTSVELLKRRRMDGLSGFANAVLRRILRERETLSDRLNRAPAYVRASLPEWIYRRLAERYGAGEADRIGAYFLSAGREVSVYDRDGGAQTLQGSLAEQEAFRAGEWMVQDPACRRVGEWADPNPGEYVVDVCAAPGGKSCHMALLLQGSGTVDARDLTAEKCALLEENAHRLRLVNLHSKVWDARVPDPALAQEDGYGKADILLCDLPCSGLGVIGRKPDICFHASPEGIQSLQRLQREILETCCVYLKKGGKLLYSTCTLTREENEDNAAWAAETLPLEFVREGTLLPGQPSDGFYIAQFRRR